MQERNAKPIQDTHVILAFKKIEEYTKHVLIMIMRMELGTFGATEKEVGLDLDGTIAQITQTVVRILSLNSSKFMKLAYGDVKDLNSIKTGFESVPPQFYFEISGLASVEKWRKIQTMAEEECY